MVKRALLSYTDNYYYMTIQFEHNNKKEGTVKWEANILKPRDIINRLIVSYTR